MCFRIFKKKNQIHPEIHPEGELNGMQRHMILSVLEHGDFYNLQNLSPSDFAKALSLINPETILTEGDINEFKKRKVWHVISLIRAILSHPCPQNRPHSQFQHRGNLIEYRDAEGNICYETKGLLGLTAYNDDSAPYVTKEAVVNFIRQLIIDEKNTYFRQQTPLRSARIR